MPVYNAGKTIETALESLRAQTYQPLEIVVVNDGSTDNTLEYLHRQRDIVLLDHSHRGIAAALNDGLAAASGDFIARMDADDVCHPQRIEEQVAYLDIYQDVGLVGCRVAYAGDRSTQAGYAAYVDWINELVEPQEIELNRFVESPLAHPSVMFRRMLFEEYGAYRAGPFPEDYELWLRWMANGVKMAKVDSELLAWHDLPNRLSRTDARYGTDAFYAIKMEYLAMWLKVHNPHHPDIVLWGAGRVTRKRAGFLARHGVRIKGYIDLKPRTLDCGTPVVTPEDVPSPQHAFVVAMVANRGARDEIRRHLQQCGYIEGVNFICAA